jgi:hypothetical protein
MPDPDPSRPAPSPAALAALSALTTAVADWRAAHPRATFAELEAAVEAEFGGVRAQLLADALPPDVGPAAADAERPTCPGCAGAMVARGRRARTLRVLGAAPLTLSRTYWTCPRCGEGVFPPG